MIAWICNSLHQILAIPGCYADSLASLHFGSLEQECRSGVQTSPPVFLFWVRDTEYQSQRHWGNYHLNYHFQTEVNNISRHFSLIIVFLKSCLCTSYQQASLIAEMCPFLSGLISQSELTARRLMKRSLSVGTNGSCLFCF